MRLELERYASGQVLVVRVNGGANAQAIKARISELADKQVLAEASKTLIDLRKTDCLLTEGEIYDICSILAYPNPAMPSTDLLALLVQPGPRFDLASFFETCARNRNLTTGAFYDPGEALDWLSISPELRLRIGSETN